MASVDSLRSVPVPRLAGKVAVITGAAGTIGSEISRRYLAEGARIAMVGRDGDKLAAARIALIAETHVDADCIFVSPFDASDPAQTRVGIERILAHFGRIDVLVNNAGSAGPRQRLENVPTSRADLERLRAGGASDTETVGDAARNLFGVAWNVVRAAAPHLAPGASIINISTIFSRTAYFGRAAYVVPKAALNSWSRRLAYELGERGIRVNTVFPGPIESERIHSVFASMDALRSAPSGTTANEITDMMTLSRNGDTNDAPAQFPTIGDVAATTVFLGSNDSGAISGHNFEITHGMVVRQESRSTFTARPDLRIVDASGHTVLVVAGEDVEAGVAVARAHAECGAMVLLGVPDDATLSDARSNLGDMESDRNIRTIALDRRDPDAIAATLRRAPGAVHGAVVLPAFGPNRFTTSLADASDDDVDAFLNGEIVGAIVIARELGRYWSTARITAAPRVVFLGNGDDGRGNAYGDIWRAAMEQLVRVWRDESELDASAGKRPFADWSNQIVRWTNTEDEGLRFAAAWTAKLLHTSRRTKPVNLYMPDSLADDTGATRATFGASESLIGLHRGKVAFITGGSAGIGGQIARLLAIAGARVIIAARRADQLATMRESIVSELTAIGYDDAAARVETLEGVDVADDETLALAIDRGLARFGSIDYLINNAGVAGAEQMVVDMSLETWRRTIKANLISNFALMARVVPEMKKRGSGYILNVSSYFGGEKYVAVAYPNRSDYAVSKAGQRAIVETLAQFVGPEIQINAIAPGPVAGDRLAGTSGGPGLFERRGKLILAAKRLNAIYAAAIAHVRTGGEPQTFVRAAMRNDIAEILADPSTPAALRNLCDAIAKGAVASEGASFGTALMDEAISTKLCERLRRGHHLSADVECGIAQAPPEPFFAPREVEREAEKVRSGVLKMLHLQHMPSELEVALATVYFLADRAVSGETFQPSGGLRQERSITERELFGRAKAERVAQLRGRNVWIVGEHPIEHMVRATRAFVEECGVDRVVVITRTEQAAKLVRQRAGAALAEHIVDIVTGTDLEAGLDRALHEFPNPAAVVSLPLGLLPNALFEGDHALDGRGFETMIEENITNHFRVARTVSLLDDVRLVFVSPDVPFGGNPAEFALANFVKTTLHALTATLAVENERLVHEVPVNQINVTRRVQSEEPRNAAEQQEELDRFARALVLESAPLPAADDSRYRSRIYRGMAITV